MHFRCYPCTTKTSSKLQTVKEDQTIQLKNDYTKTKKAQPPCANKLNQMLFALCELLTVRLPISIQLYYLCFPFFTTCNTETHHVRFLTHAHEARFTQSFFSFKIKLCSTHENNRVQCSSAGLLHKNVHISVTMRLRDESKATCTSTQYVRKMLYEHILTSSL